MPRSARTGVDAADAEGEAKAFRESGVLKARRAASAAQRAKDGGLLDFDFGAGGLEFLFDLFGFFLADALLERLGSAFDELLGFGEAESGNDGAHFLDHA